MLKILNEGSELIRRINSNSDLVEIISVFSSITQYTIYTGRIKSSNSLQPLTYKTTVLKT